ncbi:sulfotransferase [Streptomyces sp. Z26]|uniref:sulfotransferase family protein n=1 Tax=Streptomyces TaxID=1883 RepID=UPI0014045EC2|nr:sulfotransferase [Streptomyces sp. Z26]
MNFRRTVNSTLRRTTGMELRRVAKPGAPSAAPKPAAPKPADFRPTADPELDRLLRKPVFIMSAVRSGSTLLRVLLDGHSRLHAPHELHIRRLTVGYQTSLAKRSMDVLDLDTPDLEHLLWDRVLHREVAKSGKEFIVDKTPSNAFVWKRIAACWPDARYVFLLRHPASIARSWHESDPEKRPLDVATEDALRYMKAVERARGGLSGHTVRYEQLTDDPAATVKGICDFLDIEWEPGLLEYGKRPKQDLQRGLGDWREKIRSGSVQPGRDLPDAADVPENLREICAAWGYDADRAGARSE